MHSIIATFATYAFAWPDPPISAIYFFSALSYSLVFQYLSHHEAHSGQNSPAPA